MLIVKTLTHNYLTPYFAFNYSKDAIHSASHLAFNHPMPDNEVHTNNATKLSIANSHTIDFDHCIGGYATLVTACIGLVLNASGICVLLRRKGTKNLFTILLIVNLTFDLFYLVFQAIRSLETHFVSFTAHPSAVYCILIISGERFTCIGSVLTLVALEHSRYQAVTKPYKARRLELYWNKRRNQLFIYLLPILFLAICFTLPVVLEIDTEMSSSPENKIFRFGPSEIRLSTYYSTFFIGGFHLILLGIYPFSSLLYFNYYIFKSLKQRFLFIGSDHQANNLQRNYGANRKAFKALFIVTFTFLILHSLRLVTVLGKLIVLSEKNKISDHDQKHDHGNPKWLEVIDSLGNICMVINASVHYLIYI